MSIEGRCLCTGLRQAAQVATQFYDDALAPAGIKITMFRLLRRIEEAGTPNISELANIVQLDRSTLGRNLKVLERANLVRMSHGEDERMRTVELTPLGRRKFTKAVPLWCSAQRAMEKKIGMSEEDIFTIVSRLQTLEQLNAG